jgi:hypothetical protein
MSSSSLVLAAFALFTVFASPSIALAAGTTAPAPTSKPAEKAAPTPKEEPAAEEKPSSLSIAAAPVLPIGDLSRVSPFGIGGTLGFDYAFHPNAAFVARAGYIHHLPKDGYNATLGVIPIWAGARYSFREHHEGPYVEGVLGPSILLASVDLGPYGGRQTESEVRLGTALGGGYRIGKLDLGGRFVFYDLGHAGDSAGLMASVAFAFASF